MSAVLCLLACLCVSTAASRGQAPLGNASVGHAAARAALHYGVAHRWIPDDIARGSVNIQEAVDRVTHAGQAAVTLHTRGRHGGPAEGIIVEPSGTVLVLAADMVRGVLHASCVRRARPQWTIQVYTPPRAWPFSTWAVLAVMWHLAPEEARTGTARKIARDLHTWPAGQDFPWRRPRGGLPVAPAAEGLSLAATLQRHPDKRARHFLQTGTVPAAPPDSEWRWDAGEAQPLPGPWVLPLWYLPVGTLAHATQAVKGAFPQPLLPGVALLRSLKAGAARVGWREEGGRPSPYFPLVQGHALLHGEGMGTVEWGAIVPGTACRWITAAAPKPMRSPPACHRLLRAVPSLAPQHALTRDVWRAMLSHTREWLTNPGARYPPGPVLQQLTTPTPGVRHALHRASAFREHLTEKVLDLALEQLRVLYPQTHIPPAGTSNRLGRLGLQRRVEAAQPGGVVEQWLTLRNPSTAQGHWYLHQLLFLPRAAREHRQQNPYHTHPERLGVQSFPQPAPPALSPGQGPKELQQGPPLDNGHHSTAKGKQRQGWGRTGLHELRSGGLDGGLQAPRPRYHGAQAVQAHELHGASGRVRGRHHGLRGGVASATAASGPLPRRAAPPASHNAHADSTPPGGAAIRRRGGAAGRRRGEFHPPPRPGADRGKHTRAAARCTPPVARHTPRAHPRQGRGRRHTPSRASAGGGTGAADSRPPGHPTRPGRRVPVACPDRGPLDCLVQHRQARGIPAPAPCRLAAGAHPGLLYVGGPLVAGSPATHRRRPQQEAGTVMGQPPRTGLEPRPGGASTGRVAGGRHQGRGRPGNPHGGITHARPAATLAVAQRGQQNPQWVVCMFSLADAHIVLCDAERLPGPEAVVRVADCTRMINKALREGDHHALLLQVWLKDNARAARPGVWPAAAQPANVELQLAVPTTVYHWLQAFRDLRWRGKPDRQIGATHWQAWLQADPQRDAVRGLGPAPATRALDAAAPGRALAPHTVPLANLPFEPAPEGAIRKSVPLPPARGATEPTKCPLCADKYYTSGAMLEQVRKSAFPMLWGIL